MIMSLGLGIFLSTLVLAVVILYGLTKDRWGWRRILKRTALTLLALAAIIGGVYFWNQLPVPQTEYAGIRIGMTPDEVMYIKGFPPTVFGELSNDGEGKGWHWRKENASKTIASGRTTRRTAASTSRLMRQKTRSSPCSAIRMIA
jgi:hypothetical protein